MLVKSSIGLSKICFQSLDVFIIELSRSVLLKIKWLKPDMSDFFILDTFFYLDSRLVLSNLSSLYLDKLCLVKDRKEEDT